MLFVGVITVIFVMAAVVIDVGLWLAERRSVQRAADLAAAAGAQDLLVSDSDAVAAAYGWAAKNGYAASGVDVDLLCYNDSSSTAICDNPNPGAGPTPCPTPPPDSHCDSLRVTITKPSTMLFSSIFGVPAFDISASSAAGLTIQSVPTDTVILLDASSSMNFGCNGEAGTSSCPIDEARSAAHTLVDVLLGGLNTASRVGYAPYEAHYYLFGQPGRIPASWISPLTTNAPALHSVIAATTPGGGTNICRALLKADELLEASGQTTRKTIVLLTDGDNHFAIGDNPPPDDCRGLVDPVTGDNPGGCQAAREYERQVDRKTYDLAVGLGAEIYVVGLGVCPQHNGSTACGSVGNGDDDFVADRRLLKCIASGTDHYVEVTTASDIPDAFREIAAAIISRGLLE